LLTANNVLDYVSNTLPYPPATIGTGDTAVESLAFLAWKHEDNYVFLALFGTCGPEVQIVMFSTTSSADAMSRLTKVYANQSRTRIVSLKERISSITKGGSNVCDYLCSIHFVADELARIGHFLDDLLMEAEYQTIATTTIEQLCLRELLKELAHPIIKAP